MKIQKHAAVTFTCVVNGYPIDSVIVTGPNYLNLDCLAQTSTDKASCTLSDTDRNEQIGTYTYTVILRNAVPLDEGTYKCTVRSRWQQFKHEVEGGETFASVHTVEKESAAEIELIYRKLT